MINLIELSTDYSFYFTQHNAWFYRRRCGVEAYTANKSKRLLISGNFRKCAKEWSSQKFRHNVANAQLSIYVHVRRKFSGGGGGGGQGIFTWLPHFAECWLILLLFFTSPVYLMPPFFTSGIAGISVWARIRSSECSGQDFSKLLLCFSLDVIFSRRIGIHVLATLAIRQFVRFLSHH